MLRQVLVSIGLDYNRITAESEMGGTELRLLHTTPLICAISSFFKHFNHFNHFNHYSYLLHYVYFYFIPIIYTLAFFLECSLFLPG